MGLPDISRVTWQVRWAIICMWTNLKFTLASIIVSNVSRFQIIVSRGDLYQRECPKVRFWVPFYSMFFLWVICFYSWNGASFKIMQMTIFHHARRQMWILFYLILKMAVMFRWNGLTTKVCVIHLNFKFMSMSAEYIEPQMLTISDNVSIQFETDVKVIGITVGNRLTFN